MPELNKDLLPDEWWAVADCVDAYESQGGQEFPDLRGYAERVAPPHRGAALAELVKVDIERRWKGGQRRQVEDYLRDYPELGSGSIPLEDLLQYEYMIRTRHGERPTVSELRSRFPSVDERKVLESDQCFAATINFGVNPFDTKHSSDEASTPGPSGTIVFDSSAPKGSSAGPAPTSDYVASPSAMTRPATDQPIKTPARPESIGRYSVKQVLGSGSFGLVYRCFDEDLKRDVAIKVPHQKASVSKQRVKEFMHEARSAARLRHAGIVTVLDASQTDDGRVFIVYEFIKGKTLQDRLNDGEYTYEDAARWTAEAAEALHHAHKNQIIHRDVKPANLLLDEEGHVHVADFGLARMDDQFFRDDAGRVLGTIAYMSPEQAAGQSHWVSPQADIYSLGVMLYQLLCKKLPFTAGSVEDALAQIKERVPAPPRTIDDKIPKELESICLRAMAKSPADRYTTAADLAAELRRAIAGQPPSRGARPLVLGAAGAAAAAAIIVLLIWNPWRKPAEQLPNGRPQPNAAGNSRSATAAQALADMIGQRFTDLPAGIPWLSISRKGARESVRRPLDVLAGGTLHEGDQIKLYVTVDRPQYVYLYWYNAKGEPQRLWPEDPEKQTKVTNPLKFPSDEGVGPTDENLLGIDAERGAELAFVAGSDRPLTAEELTEFEKQLPYRQHEVQVERVFHITSGEQSRGLAGKMKSRKSPLQPDFETAVRHTFTSFHGMVVPHQ